MGNSTKIGTGADVRILSVKWKDNTIGYLIKEKDGDYLYKYDSKGIQYARSKGYQYLIGFKDIRKVYASQVLFPVFKSRIPTKQRRDLGQIMANLGVESYDEMDILALSKGKLLTDEISFEEYPLTKSNIKSKIGKKIIGVKSISSKESKKGEIEHGR